MIGLGVTMNLEAKQTHKELREPPLETVVLEVDADNCIRQVSESWTQVARAGGAEIELATDRVLGKPLHQFITSDTTRMYVEASLKLCRLRQEVLFRPYRCDSPTHKRFMELQLTPLEQGAVEMKHFLLREEAFEQPLHLEEVTQQKNRSAGTCLRCSFCNRLKPLEQHEWMPPEELHQSYISPLKVIHTVCPDCKGQVWQPRARPY